ncbi:hypothetical protein EGI22_02465 [Lacihabitans sp. LS3-19]|uniref:M949_RS01915 family surface polysaccharide biosynthesis protein n=1 Tax=Lacihabitans sp. LS3-19 TaxID=2487335 RepID=UPI0020CDF0A6|nr:hypothetical protein [Lacihabitans sp. LS3-19]MCP9766754.1 hypothetical protein [Lacihabitans sp. LS3-19]
MPIKYLLFSILFFCNLSSFAQINGRILSKSEIPKNIKVTGNTKSVITWKEKNGEYLVILTESGNVEAPKSELELLKAELHAYCFQKNAQIFTQKWMVYDFEEPCPFDLDVRFLKNTLQITDLDQDGKAEIWLVYMLKCRSDVSPAQLKIIMYEGQQKYAMRGETKVKLTETETYGGKFKFDNAFINGQSIFRDFAKNVWAKNVNETWEE